MKEPGLTNVPEIDAALTDGLERGAGVRTRCVSTEIGESQRIHQEMTRLISATKDRCAEMASGVCDFIARETGFEYVRVSQFVEFDRAGKPTTAQVYAGRGGDLGVVGQRYRLEDSPCSGVERFCTVCVPEGVAAAYPDDEPLREMSIESYAGVALTGNAGEQLGLVYAMSTASLVDAPAAMRRMQLIVHRFSAEVDRYRAAQERERSEERYRSLVDAMADGLVVVRDGRIVLANARAASSRGAESSAHLVGTPVGYESGQDPAGEGFEALQHIRDGERTSEVDCSVIPVEHEGEPAVQIIERHLDDAHQRERLMIKTFDLMPLAMMVITSDDRLIRMNGAMRSFCDCAGVDDLPSVLECLASPHARALEGLVERSRAEIGSHSVDVIDRSPGSHARVVMWSVYSDEQDKTCVISAQDITNQRAADRLLMREERSASTAMVAQGLVHDLGNLFGAIAAQVHVAEQRLDRGHSASEVFDDMREVLAHADELRDSLQTLGGHAGSVDRDVDVVGLVRESEALLTRMIAGEARFRVDTDRARGCVVRGEPRRLRQVLVNLVVNARDALRGASRSDGEIVVVAERVDHGVRIAVCDNGPGVPEELEERVFEPFFTTRTRGSGTGLGLAICRAVAGQHRGRIDLVSRAGGGASFVVTLPLIEKEADAVPAVPLAGVEVALVYPEGREREIMQGLLERLKMRVVDDSQHPRVRVCSAEGYAASGDGACVVVFDEDEAVPDGSIVELRRPFGLALLERSLRRALVSSEDGGGS